MTMEYKLIQDCQKGFILTREPETVSGELIISFTGAPEGATAIFDNGEGNSLYRLLKDETCAIPTSFLKGRVKVTVAVLNGKEGAPKFVCESIYTKEVPHGVLVCADGLDVSRELIDAYGEIQAVGKVVCDLKTRLDDLNEKVVRLLDGYDFE